MLGVLFSHFVLKQKKQFMYKKMVHFYLFSKTCGNADIKGRIHSNLKIHFSSIHCYMLVVVVGGGVVDWVFVSLKTLLEFQR